MRDLNIGIYSDRTEFWSLFLGILFSNPVEEFEDDMTVHVFHINTFGLVDISRENDCDMDYIIIDKYAPKSLLSNLDKMGIDLIYGEEFYE